MMLGFGEGLHDLITNAVDLQAPGEVFIPPTANVRVTNTGDRRITVLGDVRVIV